MSSQTRSTNVWLEPSDSDDQPVRAVLTESAPGFAPSTTGNQDALLVDLDGDGVYTLVNLNDRLYAFDDGAGGITFDALMYLSYNPTDGVGKGTFSRASTASSVLDTAGTDPTRSYPATDLLTALAAPAAQFIADGVGGYTLSNDFTEPEAAAFFALADGSYGFVALDTDEHTLKMVSVGSTLTVFN